MPELQLYDQLLQFPLFQGMSRADLLLMAGNTRFGFQKVAHGKAVVKEDQACQQLTFLVRGTLKATTQAADHAYTFVEIFNAPFLIQPEALFGLTQRYTRTMQADTEGHLINISKDEVLRMLDDFLVFRLNLLGLLATQSQRLARHPWRRVPQTLEERITRFFTDHCLYPAGQKEVHILMTRLADELNASRLDISKALNQMQTRSLLTLHRGRIVIPMLERLIM